MDIILTLLGEPFVFNFPVGFFGGLVWFAFLLLAGLLAWRTRDFAPLWIAQRTLILGGLLLATLAATLFIGLRLPETGILPQPGRTLLATGPALMLLSAAPWVLAAGLLGPLPAALLAAISGALLAGFDTHNAFQPLYQAILAILLSVALRQRYRTLAFRLWRRPLLASGLIGLLVAPMILFSLPFMVNGAFAVRLDYALHSLAWATLAGWIPLLLAGLLGELAAFALPGLWGGAGPLKISPAESSLQTRLFYLFGPLGLVLLVLMTAGIWKVSGDAASSVLEQRLRTTGDAAAQGVPFFLETGQSLIAQLAQDPRLLNTQSDELRLAVAENLRSVPYFDQLAVLDQSGRLRGGFPVNSDNELLLTEAELQAIQLAFSGVQFQMYALPPGAQANAGRMAFVQALEDSSGAVQAVLLGRTSLSINPFTVPVLENLNTMTDISGQGILLDDHGLIMAHPLTSWVGTLYDLPIPEEAEFRSLTATDGTRQLVYTRPIAGRGWVVITSVPAQAVQQMTIQMAAPALAGLALALLIVMAVAWWDLRTVTGSLSKLAGESTRMASGNLEQPLALAGAGELGQLSQSFEHLRQTFKQRLDELNQLLSASQGVASALEMEKAIGPVLAAALSTGASAARLALTPAALPDFEEERNSHFGQGKAADRYQGLDESLLKLTSRQTRVALSAPGRARLPAPEGTPVPEALLAVALRHEGTHYGVLWVAYDTPRTFTEEEMSFLSTLAGQAALAAANARLYLSSQLGRQRLEAILAATPDPVLVTDHRGRLLLANPAAQSLLAVDAALVPGEPLAPALVQPELQALLTSDETETQSLELVLGNKKTYFVTASGVITEGRQMGRIVVLHEITHYKEADALKTEFVDAVSHDLRHPLTLMLGYTTMLQMVGNLNDKQQGYLQKIDHSIQDMSRLVNNLLDLGRFEAGLGLGLNQISVTDVARQVAESLRPQALQKNISLTLETPAEGMPLVELDSEMIQLAMRNLVENAIKYTNSNGQVALKLAIEGERLLFSVRDTGIGIAAVDLPRLFERFYRVAARNGPRQPGSGLGLAIVKSVAERHGGNVQAESRLGEGSVFTLSLPLWQPEQ